MVIKTRKVGSGITEKFEIWTDEPVDDITFSEKVRVIRQHAIDNVVFRLGGVIVPVVGDEGSEICRLLVKRCDQLLKALEAGDVEAVGWLAFEVSELQEQLVIKWGWEDHALRGKGTLAAAAEGGRNRALAQHNNNSQRDREMAEEFKRRSERSNKSASALKEEIGRERGLKRTASIDAIKRGLEMLKISSG